MRKLKLVTRFYGGLFLTNFLVSLSCVFLIRYFGHKAYEILGILFWFKVITIGLVFYMTIYYKKNELYYYQNLGLSKLQLAIPTSVADFLLWLILILLQLLIGIPGYIFNAGLWSVLLVYLYTNIKNDTHP